MSSRPAPIMSGSARGSPGEYDQDHQQEDDAQSRRPVGRPEEAGERFSNPKEDAGEQRAGQVADAAQDDDGERFYREPEALVGIDRIVEDVQHAGDGNDGGAEGNCCRMDCTRTHPADARADRILRDRTHRAAEPGAGQDDVQRERQDGDAEQDVELCRRDDDPLHDEYFNREPDVDRRRTGKQRGKVADDQQQADRHQYGSDGGLHRIPALQRLEQIDVHQPAEPEEDRQQHKRNQNRIESPPREHEARSDAGNGKQRAVREIEDAHDAVDQRQVRTRSVHRARRAGRRRSAAG